MRIKHVSFVAVLVAVMGFSTVLHADNVGYIDMERLWLNLKEGREIQTDLQKKREEYQKLLETKQKEVDQARKDKKSDEDIQKMLAKVETELRPQQEQIMQNENEVQGRILSKVREFSKVVAKQYGIDVVLDKRFVFSGGFDLTDFVVEKLNAPGRTETPSDKTGIKSKKNR
jgi:Skp family chaperone for outer membrane proteins